MNEYLCVVIALNVALATAITLVVLLTVQVGLFLCFLLCISEENDLVLLQKFAEKSSEKETWQTFSAWIDALKQEPKNIARQAENNFQRAIDERDVDFFYFVQNTLGVNIKNVLEREEANYHESPGYECIYLDLQRIAGEDIREPR